MSARSGLRKALLLVIVGVLVTAAGIVFIAVPARDLPIYQAGHLYHGQRDVQTGYVLLLIGLAVLSVGVMAWPKSPVEKYPPRPVVGSKDGTPRPYLGMPPPPRGVQRLPRPPGQRTPE